MIRIDKNLSKLKKLSSELYLRSRRNLYIERRIKKRQIKHANIIKLNKCLQFYNVEYCRFKYNLNNSDIALNLNSLLNIFYLNKL